MYQHDDERESAMPTFVDQRRLEMGPIQPDPPMDQVTQRMEADLQAISCRLIERATGGRLTFDGDKVVRAAGGRDMPRPAHASTNTSPMAANESRRAKAKLCAASGLAESDAAYP